MNHALVILTTALYADWEELHLETFQKVESIWGIISNRGSLAGHLG